MTWWFLLVLDAQAGVVINEVLADPGAAIDANCDGLFDSTDDEFLEIVNTGPGNVDLSGWTLEDLTSVRHTIGAGLTLKPYESLVVFGGGGTSGGAGAWCPLQGEIETATSLSLNNSGDTITLRDDGGTLIDEVAYGSEANSDESIVRDPELIGTSWVKHETVSASSASPGRMADMGPFHEITGTTSTDTGGGGGCDLARDLSGVVINEFLINAPGTDDGLEWVEIYNGSGGAVDMSGWGLAAGTKSYGLGDPFPVGTTLPANGHFVLGQSGAAAAIVDLVNAGWSLGNATSSSDALRLEDCQGGVLDSVVYGGPNDDLFEDDQGVATSLADAPGEGRSAARVPDGLDTDRSSQDFAILEMPTPGLANDAEVDSPCGGTATGLKVNEFMPDPEGGDTDLEWIELYNAGPDALELTGWSLQTATSSWSTAFTFESGSVGPGELLVVGGALVPEADVVFTASLGNASSSSDAIRILDCAGFPVDTVIYGSPNSDGFVDDLGEVALSTAPKGGSGFSLQRIEDGLDTEDSGHDFVGTDAPSPGASNPVVEPTVCVPSEGTVTLNEIMVDPDGSDDGLEWIELYNSGTQPVSVAGWMFSAGTKDYASVTATLPGGVEVPGQGWLVIGGELVEEADVVLPFSIGNGTGTDGVRLFDCEMSAVDTVIYGDEGNEDLMVDDTELAQEPYGDPGSDQTIARVADGGDSDAAGDWFVSGSPTPGQSNVREVGEIVDPGLSSGCGSKSAPKEVEDGGPEAKDPEGGCVTAPLPMGGVELGLLLFVVARRRSRRE